MRGKEIILVVIICFLIGGCNSDQDGEFECSKETYFANELRDDELFTLVLGNEVSPIRVGEEIEVKIRNLSKYEIWFPYDLNLLVVNKFAVNTFSIVEFEITPIRVESIILGKTGSSTDEYEFTVSPSLFVTEGPANIDIAIAGQIYHNEEICSGRYSSILSIEIFPAE